MNHCEVAGRARLLHLAHIATAGPNCLPLGQLLFSIE
jgi:hypothetical protein